MEIYLYRKKVKNLRMLFCQLTISALTHQKDLLDFGKVFIEFNPSSDNWEDVFGSACDHLNMKELYQSLLLFICLVWIVTPKVLLRNRLLYDRKLQNAYTRFFCVKKS